MRKLNFRPFLFIFAFVAVGLLFSLTAFFLPPLGIALLSVLAAFLIAAGAVFLLKREGVKAFCALFALLLSAVTAVIFLMTAADRAAPTDNALHAVSGRVTEHCAYAEDGTFEAVLDSLRIDGQEADGKLRVFVYDAELSYTQVRCGYTLSFSSTLTATPAIDERGVHADVVRSDVRYLAFAEQESATVGTGAPTATEAIRLGLRDHLVSVMGDGAGYTAYGMIADDRYLLDDEISDAFAAAGIGHILAVSGLHIGLIAMLLNRLFRLLPLPKTVGRAATTLLLVLYTVFTGGSPSAVRALIMCTVAVWAPAFGKTDRLNALCLAATVCLCVSPFYLFEAGFLLSVSAVGGLIFFAGAISKALRKIRLPKKAAEAVGAATSVQLTILPVTAFFFHRLNLYSLPVNAVGMGAVSLLFIALVAVLPFSFLFPPLLVPVGAMIGWLLRFCALVSALPLASVTVQVSAAVFLIPVLLFFASRFFMVANKKYAALAVLIACTAIGFASENGIGESDALLAAGGKSGITVVYRGKERYLFGDFTDGRAAAAALDRARVREENFILYLTDPDDDAAAGIVEFSGIKSVKEVRFPRRTDAGGLKILLDAGLTVVAVDPGGAFDAATADGEPCGWLYATENGRAFIGQTKTAVDAMIPADVVRCVSARFADGYPDKLFLTARPSDADNAVATSYGNSFLYRFDTKKLTAV